MTETEKLLAHEIGLLTKWLSAEHPVWMERELREHTDKFGRVQGGVCVPIRFAMRMLGAPIDLAAPYDPGSDA